MKIKAAKERAGAAGGGASGLENRKCQKVGVKCDICLHEFLSFADMRIHYDARHPREAFPEETIKEAFAAAKSKTAERRVGHQQGKLDYKHKDGDKATSGKPARAGGVSDDVAALLSAGLAGLK
ncbi:hypothetical protein DYB32_001150 [Aphanomyces invadans]|nr:hypothetical protein DYB32_001150 [Aphanomyces invadans]